MHRGLNIVLNSDDAEDAVQLSTRDTGDIIAFEFSRKPPHHELYDSVFHGDELDPAKIKIKMRVGNGIMRPAPTDTSRPLLSEDYDEYDSHDDLNNFSSRQEDGRDIENSTNWPAKGESESEQSTDQGNTAGRAVSRDVDNIDEATLTANLQRRILELEEREKQLRTSLTQALSMSRRR